MNQKLDYKRRKKYHVRPVYLNKQKCKKALLMIRQGTYSIKKEIKLKRNKKEKERRKVI